MYTFLGIKWLSPNLLHCWKSAQNLNSYQRSPAVSSLFKYFPRNCQLNYFPVVTSLEKHSKCSKSYQPEKILKNFRLWRAEHCTFLGIKWLSTLLEKCSNSWFLTKNRKSSKLFACGEHFIIFFLEIINQITLTFATLLEKCSKSHQRS